LRTDKGARAAEASGRPASKAKGRQGEHKVLYFWPKLRVVLSISQPTQKKGAAIRKKGGDNYTEALFVEWAFAGTKSGPRDGEAVMAWPVGRKKGC